MDDCSGEFNYCARIQLFNSIQLFNYFNSIIVNSIVNCQFNCQYCQLIQFKNSIIVLNWQDMFLSCFVCLRVIVSTEWARGDSRVGIVWGESCLREWRRLLWQRWLRCPMETKKCDTQTAPVAKGLVTPVTACMRSRVGSAGSVGSKGSLKEWEWQEWSADVGGQVEELQAVSTTAIVSKCHRWDG